MRGRLLCLFSIGVASVLGACGGGDSTTSGLTLGTGAATGAGAATGSGATGSGGTIIVTGGTSGTGSASGGTGASTGGGTFEVPADFTKVETGGFRLGDPVTSTSTPPVTGECNNELIGTIRDFKGGPPDGHPDFEMDLHQFTIETGIVDKALGSDRKPVYAPKGATRDTTGKDAFDEWYRTLADQPDQNLPFYLTLYLMPDSSGTYVFQSDTFFPLDGQGYGDQDRSHNFHFTLELHTTFTYHGGEMFTFIGDDDVFIFVNNVLAVDLGGVHPALTGSVDLDRDAAKLGILKGGTYTLDMFQAERHTTDSHFRVETTIDFTNCGEFVPDVPPPR